MNPAATGSPRQRAISCLAEWSGSGKPIQGFIDSAIHGSPLRDADRQLAVMLVMGAIRRQQYLDAILARFSTTPLQKMKPLTLAALRTAIYQICFLERIPDSAAVNETVKALKKCRQPGWLIRFVNGTLRAVAREKDNLPGPETAGPDHGPILEHPDWLTRRWEKNYGRQQMEEICRINTREPRLCIQANTGLISRDELSALLTKEGIVCRPGRYAPDSLILPQFRGAVTALPGFDAGLFLVQDQAARLATLLCGPMRPNGRYLDGCAGLGGKSSALAGALPAGASLTAVEPDRRRTRLLQENLVRLRCNSRVETVAATLQQFAATKPLPFDGILIDAPCSGTGVIGKHPDIKWNRRPEDLDLLERTQQDLLRTAASLLAPGGFLVYATCSLEPEENQWCVKHFLASARQFSSTDCRDYLPDSATQLVDSNGFFASLPSAEIEGFFAARLVHRGNS